jgi:hypothetical protein
MFNKYFQNDVEIECFVEGEEKPVRPPKRKPDQLRGVSKERKPVVDKLMKEFDGEVIRRYKR